MLRPYANPSQLDDVTSDLDAELLEQQLGDRAAGDPRDRFPRARPLQDVAPVHPGVLEGPREVGVPRARPRDLAPSLGASPRGVRFGGHDVPPVLPVAIPDEHRDRGAERLAGAHAREPLDLVRLDLHAGAPAVPTHAALQLGVDPFGRHGEARRDPLENPHQTAPVRLACRREPKRHATVPPRLPIITREPDRGSGSRPALPPLSLIAAARGTAGPVWAPHA